MISCMPATASQQNMDASELKAHFDGEMETDDDIHTGTTQSLECYPICDYTVFP